MGGVTKGKLGEERYRGRPEAELAHGVEGGVDDVPALGARGDLAEGLVVLAAWVEGGVGEFLELGDDAGSGVDVAGALAGLEEEHLGGAGWEHAELALEGQVGGVGPVEVAALGGGRDDDVEVVDVERGGEGRLVRGDRVGDQALQVEEELVDLEDVLEVDVADVVEADDGEVAVEDGVLGDGVAEADGVVEGVEGVDEGEVGAGGHPAAGEGEVRELGGGGGGLEDGQLVEHLLERSEERRVGEEG